MTETANGLWTPSLAPPHDPTAMSLRIVTDDGSTTLATNGYKLYVEADHYLIRVWHEIENGELVRTYRRWLHGEPRDLFWAAWGLHSWDDLDPSGSGPWGPGDRRVDQHCIDPLVAEGLLLPYRTDQHALLQETPQWTLAGHRPRPLRKAPHPN